EGFAAAVAGRRHAHQPRVERVLHVADEHAVLDQGRAIGRRAFVVDVERTAAPVKRAVVDDGHARRGHALADAAGVGRGALAVEVAFQAMADRFVQEYAGPARAEHHGHRAGRRVHRFQVHQCLAQRFARELFRLAAGEQLVVAVASATAGETGFAAPVLFDDHLHVDPHQRTHVGGEHAVAARDEYGVDTTGEAGPDLAHARIGGTQHAVERAQGLDLVLVVEAVDRIHGRIQARRRHRASAAAHERTRWQFAPVAGNGARGPGRVGQCDRIDIVGVGEAGLLAGDRAHAHALLDRTRTVLDVAVL